MKLEPKLRVYHIWFQYFVFDFHMAPVMLFDKIISFTVGWKLSALMKIILYNL